MNQTELANLLETAFDTMEPRRAPADVLGNVFAVTRATPQRRGFGARLWNAGQSVATLTQAWRIRPLVGIAAVLALLALLVVSAAFIGGIISERPQTGWRVLDPDAPEGEHTTVSSIVRRTDGFLALGTSFGDSPNECGEAISRGRVWTSPDGDEWVETSGSSLLNANPQRIVATDRYLFTVGLEQFCDRGQPNNRGRVWRSTDGVTWEALPETDMFQYGNIPLFEVFDGKLVAAGVFQEQPVSGVGDFGPTETKVWSSSDGSEWIEMSTIPGAMPVALASKDGVLVLLAWPENGPRAILLYSTDTGQTWHESDRPSGLPESQFTVVAGEDVFLAAGDELAIVSPDGRTWSAATTDPTILEGVVGLWALPTGFIAVRTERADGVQGQECRAGGLQTAVPSLSPGSSDPVPVPDPQTPLVAPTDYCYPIPASGGTSLSADGLEWRVGPDFPMVTNAGRLDPSDYVVGSGDGALLVADRAAGARIWYAPLSDFRP